MKFKIGDRVRLTRSISSRPAGLEGEVIAVKDSPSSSYPITVQFFGDQCPVRETEVELLPSRPRRTDPDGSVWEQISPPSMWTVQFRSWASRCRPIWAPHQVPDAPDAKSAVIAAMVATNGHYDAECWWEVTSPEGERSEWKVIRVADPSFGFDYHYPGTNTAPGWYLVVPR